ncbi:ABC transporter permease [Schaalia sp. 19OD2882]|uniref:ABC transporter permease n=1 Tax=Schaalia sp. 19OD2882 TaxID=2794089 RepID=UPI001C1F1697|nr:ABC transporter permease [Schaalia sp. 19OD2882]QWW20051.1 ABC transporter permease [Schaalia sp. 19OD2882]
MSTRTRTPGFATAVRLEFAKMKRLRTLPIMSVLVGAAVLFSGIGLFGEHARAIADDPAAFPWASELMLVTMVNALIHPILVAVLVSRQVDVENTGGGWIFNAGVGLRPGFLCRVKLVVLAGVLGLACALQMGSTVGLGILSGISVPLDVAIWIGYFVMLWLLDLALAVIHVWLSSRFENQLVSVGVGLLGGFAAMFLLLAPAPFARVIPWGHYAVIAPVQMNGGEDAFSVTYAAPDHVFFFLMLALAAGAAWFLTRRLDLIER